MPKTQAQTAFIQKLKQEIRECGYQPGETMEVPFPGGRKARNQRIMNFLENRHSIEGILSGDGREATLMLTVSQSLYKEAMQAAP
jgi:hypothetical protein